MDGLTWKTTTLNALQWVHPQSKGVHMSRRSVQVAVLAYGCFVALVFLCGYVSQKIEQSKQAQCFKFDDREQRFACLRRS